MQNKDIIIDHMMVVTSTKKMIHHSLHDEAKRWIWDKLDPCKMRDVEAMIELELARREGRTQASAAERMEMSRTNLVRLGKRAERVVCRGYWRTEFFKKFSHYKGYTQNQIVSL